MRHFMECQHFLYLELHVIPVGKNQSTVLEIEISCLDILFQNIDILLGENLCNVFGGNLSIHNQSPSIKKGIISQVE